MNYRVWLEIEHENEPGEWENIDDECTPLRTFPTLDEAQQCVMDICDFCWEATQEH